MTIHLERSDWTRARSLIEHIDTVDDPVTATMDAAILHQGDVAALSGLNTTTLRKIRDGKRATKAQRAALKFTVLSRLLNL